MMDKKPWTEWRVSGIFCPRAARLELLRQAAADICMAAGLTAVVYLRAKRAPGTPLFQPCFALEDMSTKRTNLFLHVAALLSPRTLLILDDVETIHNYPQSMTRNIINHLAPRTPYKLIAGNALVVSTLADLYAPWAVLDKRILHANHYWCFTEDHREVSVFDGKSIVANKDVTYLAAKLRPFLSFDLEPENAVQTELYTAVRAAPNRERVQDITMLRL